MKITIGQSGFVSGDLLDPVAYAGEMNSRVIEITHPLFENSFYQLLILKENRPYILGIQDGKVMLPPSLTDIAGTLQCQFMALRKNDTLDLCECTPSSTNDCGNMIFKSDKFNLIIAEGLNINGLTPIPPYEQLVDMYNNMAKAKIALEQSKLDNENIANSIDEKIQHLQNSEYLNNINIEKTERENSDNEINDRLNTILTILTDKIEKLSDKIDDFITTNTSHGE